MRPLITATLLAVALLSDAVKSSQLPELTSYAPIIVDCPADVQWIRPATGLSKAEADWVQGRKKVALGEFAAYLERLQLCSFDVADYVQRLQRSNYSSVPTLGFAISGGGWASAFTGTGALRALDSRTEGANDQRTGGLLQSMTYYSGQSGGAWPILSFAVHDFPTADEIVDIWRPEISRLSVTNDSDYAATSTTIFEQVAAKAEAGFNVSTGDYLGRVFSYEFIGGYEGGINVTLSSVVKQSKFKSHDMPFPILQASEVVDGDVEYYGVKVPAANTTMYDFTPFEFGSWDGAVSGFTPMKYLGTDLDNGSPVNKSACVYGFDTASYVFGAAAGAFNFWYIEDLSNGTIAGFSKRSASANKPTAKRSLSKRADLFPFAVLETLIQAFEKYFGLTLAELAYPSLPNPFKGLSSADTYHKASSELVLVDSTESGQAIPLWSLIQPARSSEFIIAWDNDQDAAPYNWNNGTNLYDTYIAADAAGLAFPIVPPASTFVNRNYTTNPVFFGCDISLTTKKDTSSPIILYLANAPYSTYSNFSYEQSAMSRAQLSDIFTNSFNQITQGNGTLDPEWPACLGCAAIERSLAKVNLNRTQQCSQCFERYCWDGTEDAANPQPVNPTLILDPALDYAEWNVTHQY